MLRMPSRSSARPNVSSTDIDGDQPRIRRSPAGRAPSRTRTSAASSPPTARIGSTPVSRHSHQVNVATMMRNAPCAMLMMLHDAEDQRQSRGHQGVDAPDQQAQDHRLDQLGHSVPPGRRWAGGGGRLRLGPVPHQSLLPVGLGVDDRVEVAASAGGPTSTLPDCHWARRNRPAAHRSRPTRAGRGSSPPRWRAGSP